MDNVKKETRMNIKEMEQRTGEMHGRKTGRAEPVPYKRTETAFLIHDTEAW